MSSSAAPLRGVGWAAPGTASTPPPSPVRGSPSGAELDAFKRQVRPSWWRSLWPLYGTAIFGAAVVLVASAAPAPVTVRRMLAPAAHVQPNVGPATQAGDEYQLPEHWRAAAAPSPPACNPMSGIGC